MRGMELGNEVLLGKEDGKVVDGVLVCACECQRSLVQNGTWVGEGDVWS